VIVVAPHGLGKTMIAKNLVHEAILAGHSARFLTAADLILDLTRQETARALQHRLRSYLRPSLLATTRFHTRTSVGRTSEGQSP
jgi:DNA replication protein DnaC